MNTKPAKYIIWDFDGTIAYRDGGWSGALLAVLQQHEPHLAITLDQVRPFLKAGFPWHAPENAHLGLTADEWWDDLNPVFFRTFRGLGVAPDRARVLAQKVRSEYLLTARFQVYPDAVPTLSALTGFGWTHLLLTNHVPELPTLVNELSLSGCFAALFNSGQTGYEKPNPKAYRTVIDWIGPDAQVWMVGDNYQADYLGARNAGIASILVRQSHPDALPFCENLEQVVAIINCQP